MQRGICVAAAHRLDEGANHVVVLVTLSVVSNASTGDGPRYILSVHRNSRAVSPSLARHGNGGLERGEGFSRVSPR